MIKAFKILLSKTLFRIKYRGYLNSKKGNLFKHLPSLKLSESFRQKKTEDKHVLIATQVGRGGGKWLCDILNSHSSISAYGERNRLIESQFRFYTSYNSPMNYLPFIDLLKSEVLTDWEYRKYSYISSPYFSHGLNQVYNSLQPKKVIILLNSAFKLAVSLYNKGWYLEDVQLAHIEEDNFIPAQFANEESHYYGRYLNIDIDRSVFNGLTRLGKIGAYMSSTLDAIFNSLKDIPKEKIHLFQLSEHDQNYEAYIKMMKKLELSPELSQRKFLSLKKRTSGSFENKIPCFSEKEVSEFKIHTELYEKRYEQLINIYSN